MTNSILTKICSKCQTEKPLSEYYKDKSKKDGIRLICKDCDKKRAAEYRKINHEKIAKKLKKYCNEYREELRERSHLFHIEHREIRNQQNRKCYNAKREINKKKMRKYYAEHKEQSAIASKIYRNTEKGKYIVKKSNHKRRALKLNATVEDFSPLEIFERDVYQCQICGKKTSTRYKNPNHPLYTNLDHIVPLSKGGEHSRLNTQVLCHQCNMEKRNKEDFGDQLRLFG